MMNVVIFVGFFIVFNSLRIFFVYVIFFFVVKRFFFFQIVLCLFIIEKIFLEFIQMVIFLFLFKCRVFLRVISLFFCVEVVGGSVFVFKIFWCFIIVYLVFCGFWFMKLFSLVNIFRFKFVRGCFVKLRFVKVNLFYYSNIIMYRFFCIIWEEGSRV